MATVNLAEVTRYANRITEMIQEDMDEVPAMRGAQSFTDLHDHLDANEYMIHAAVPFAGEMGVEFGTARYVEIMDFYVFVQDEVSRRLGSGITAVVLR